MSVVETRRSFCRICAAYCGIEADVEEWIRERIAESRDGAEGAAHRSQEEGDTNEDVI